MRVPIRSDANQSGKNASRRKNSGAVKVTVSIGLAHQTERSRTPVDVLKAADKALYAAKSQGRNRVVSK
jgi:diguanylate cyclase (GGDEF)-like protein